MFILVITVVIQHVLRFLKFRVFSIFYADSQDWLAHGSVRKILETEETPIVVDHEFQIK